MLNASSEIENSPDPFEDQKPPTSAPDPEIAKSPDPFANQPAPNPIKESKSDVLRRISKEEGITDPTPLLAIGNQELGKSMKPTVSGAGAVGGMQVLPATGLRYVKPEEWATDEGKMRAGVRYYKDLLTQFNGNEQQAIAGYFTGQGNVNKAVKAGANLPNTLDPISNLRTPQYVNQVQQKIDKNIPDDIKSSPDPFGDVPDDIKSSPDPFAAPAPTVNVGAPGRAVGPPMTPQQQTAAEPWRQPAQPTQIAPVKQPSSFDNLLPTAEDKFRHAISPITASNVAEQYDITAANARRLKGSNLSMPGNLMSQFDPIDVTYDGNEPGKLKQAIYNKLGIAGIAKELKEKHGVDLLTFPVTDQKTGEIRNATDEEMAQYAKKSQSGSVTGKGIDTYGATVPVSQATIIAAKAYKDGGIEAYRKAVDLLQQQKAEADQQIKSETPEDQARREAANVPGQLIAGANEAAIKNLQFVRNAEDLATLGLGPDVLGGLQKRFEEQGSTAATRQLPSPETFGQSLARQAPGMAADFSRMAAEATGLGPAGALTIPGDVAIQNLNKPIHEQLKAQWENLPMTAASLVPGGPMVKSLALGPTAAAQTLYGGGSNQQALSQAALMSLLPVMHGGESQEFGNRIIEGFKNPDLQRAMFDYVQSPTLETTNAIDEHLDAMGLDAKQSQEFLTNLKTRFDQSASSIPPEVSMPATRETTTTPESLKSTQGENENASEIRSDQTTVDQQGNVNEGSRTESGSDLQQRAQAGASAGDTEQRQEGQVNVKPEQHQAVVQSASDPASEVNRSFDRLSSGDTSDDAVNAFSRAADAAGFDPELTRAFIDDVRQQHAAKQPDAVVPETPEGGQDQAGARVGEIQSEVKPNEQSTQSNPVAPDFDTQIKRGADALNDDNSELSKAVDRVHAGDTSDDAINAVRTAARDAGLDGNATEQLVDGSKRIAARQPVETPGPPDSETPIAKESVGESDQTVEPPKPPEFERTSRPPSAGADKVNENDHFNFKRSQFSSAESEQAFRDLIKRTVAENGTAHKRVVSRAEFVQRVNEIDPELAKEAVKGYRTGEPTPSTEVFQAAVEYSQNLSREAMETRRFISDAGDQLSVAERAKLEDHAARLENDSVEVMSGAVGARSQYGRNLSSLATMKMDKDSPAYMIRRADAAAKARGDDLASKDWQIQRERIKQVSIKLEQAKMERDDALQRLSQAGKPKRKTATEESKSLSQFVRAKGGFKSDADLQGEINQFRSKESGTTGMFGKKGMSPDAMREAAQEAGYLKEGETINDLMEKLHQDLGGKKVYSTQREQGLYDKELAAQYRRANPEEFQTWQQRFTSKLDKLEQDARARLSQSLNPNTVHDITDLPRMAADLAIILASKIAKKGIALTEIRKEMTDEFGDHFTKDQDRIERAALEIHDDQRLEALTEAAKVPDKEVRKSALAELKGEVVKRDQAERKAAKEADDVKKNLVKFNAESRLEAAKNAAVAERKAVAAEARAKAIEARDEQRRQETAGNRSIRADQFEKDQQQKAKSQELGAAETDAAEARRQADKFNAESKQQQAKAEEALRKRQYAQDARDAATKARKAQRDAELNEQKGIQQEAVNAKKQAAQDANPVYQLGVEGKATELRLNQPGETATPEDLAKIGAAKLHEPGMTAAKWTAEMQKFGKAFTDNQREIRESASKLSSDAKDQVKAQQQQQTAVASDAYKAAKAQGKTETEARAAAREARTNSGALTDEQLAKLQDNYKQAQTKVQAAQRELAQNFANLEQGKLDKASTVIKAGLISSVRTLAKIVISHSTFMAMEAARKVPSALADIALSKITGNDRTIGGLSLSQMAEAAKVGVKRGLPDAYQKLRTGYFPEGEDIYSRVQGTSNPLESREFHSQSRLLNLWVNGIMRTHSAVYSIHRVMGAAMALREIAEVGAKNEVTKAVRDGKLDRADAKSYQKIRADELFNKPSETMVQHAIEAAEETAFVNENAFAKKVAKVKGASGPVGRFIEDRLLPFSKVPSNVAARTAEYATGTAIAPLRAIYDRISHGEFTPEDQSRFVKTFGRGTVGAGIMAAGYLAASQGYATGYVQGYDEKASLHIGGRTFHTGLVPPLGTLFAVGATLYELNHFPMDKNTPAGGKVYANAVLGSALKAGEEQPMLGELTKLSDLLESKDKSRAFKKFLGGIAGQPIPTLVSDTAAQIDRTKREKESINSYVRERIPFLRQTLPVSPFPGREPNKLFDPFASIPTNPASSSPGIRLKEFKPRH